jgi:hypothetical protein
MFEGKAKPHVYFAPSDAMGASAFSNPALAHPPIPGTVGAAQSAPGHRDGWLAVLIDVMFGETDGVFSVAWKMFRSPVKTTLRLAADTTYKGYWKFMLACMGADLTLLFGITPWVGSHFFHLQAQNRGVESLMIQGLQLTGMPILTFVQFYFCSWLGSARRVPLEYVKLCSLSVGYGWLLTILAMLAEVVAIVVLMLKGFPVDAVRADQMQALATMIAVMAYVALSHRAFWGMSVTRALLSTLFIATMSWVVVYPGLGWIAQSFDLAGRLKGLAN